MTGTVKAPDAEATAKAIEWLKAMTTEDWLLLDKYMPDDLRERLRSALTASASEPVPCRHEPYEGRCVHCNVPFVDGRPYLAPVPASEPEPVAKTLHGPFGWLNGVRGLSEDTWELESDPLENSDEYFAIPLYAMTDPFKEASKGPAPTPKPFAWLGEGDGFKSFTRKKSVADGWQKSIKVTPVYGLSAALANPVPTPDGAVEALRELLERERRRYEDTPGAVAFFQRNNAKAIAALSAALSHPADGWRDIESAPKDGSRILSAKNFGGKVHEAAIIRWSETEDEWWDDDADQYAFPDLWMLLPAPAAKPEGE